ncbi:MAG: hypothetical protein FJ128_06555 [Deltaproteobacteria bacterium]|nr:hypothetical protein [Deltaproteobacteria bacterium]
MKRNDVSMVALLEWMNSQLSNYDNCDDCRFTSVLQLREYDQDGCNWSSANLQCSGVPVDVCAQIANDIVAHAKRLFNVK